MNQMESQKKSEVPLKGESKKAASLRTPSILFSDFQGYQYPNTLQVPVEIRNEMKAFDSKNTPEPKSPEPKSPAPKRLEAKSPEPKRPMKGSHGDGCHPNPKKEKANPETKILERPPGIRNPIAKIWKPNLQGRSMCEFDIWPEMRTSKHMMKHQSSMGERCHSWDDAFWRRVRKNQGNKNLSGTAVSSIYSDSATSEGSLNRVVMLEKAIKEIEEMDVATRQEESENPESSAILGDLHSEACNALRNLQNHAKKKFLERAKTEKRLTVECLSRPSPRLEESVKIFSPSATSGMALSASSTRFPFFVDENPYTSCRRNSKATGEPTRASSASYPPSKKIGINVFSISDKSAKTPDHTEYDFHSDDESPRPSPEPIGEVTPDPPMSMGWPNFYSCNKDHFAKKFKLRAEQYSISSTKNNLLFSDSSSIRCSQVNSIYNL